MIDLNYEGIYEKLHDVIADDAEYQAVVDIIESERTTAMLRRKEEQARGIDRAKKAQVLFGRPRKAKPPKYDKVMRLYFSGDLTIVQAANLLEVSKSLCYSWICEEREKRMQETADNATVLAEESQG